MQNIFFLLMYYIIGFYCWEVKNFIIWLLNIIYSSNYIILPATSFFTKENIKVKSIYCLKGTLLDGAGNLYFSSSTSASPKVFTW